MSRFKTGVDLLYAEHESNERLKRVLALDVRYGDCARPVAGIEHIGSAWSPAHHCYVSGEQLDEVAWQYAKLERRIVEDER